jgi:RiboL-PSP-HEPN
MAFGPYDAAKACIRRSRRLIALSQEDLTDPKVKKDLRRAAVVMAIAGIDSYMHWLVYHRISKIRVKGDLPKSLAALDLPFTEIAAMAESTVRARATIRPWVHVKRAMQKRLFKETFQSYDQVGQALSWSGVEKPWKTVAGEMGETAPSIKSRLDSLVHRRNQIVHEGDILRAVRPRNLKYNDIEHDQVVCDVDWLERLLKAIETIVQA